MFLVLPHQLLQVMHSKHAQAASPPYGRATLAGRTIRDITHPSLIHIPVVESSVQYVWRYRQTMSRVSRRNPPPAVDRTQSLTHKAASYTFRTGFYTSCVQFFNEPWAAVCGPASRVLGGHVGVEFSTPQRPRAWPSHTPLTVAAA